MPAVEVARVDAIFVVVTSIVLSPDVSLSVLAQIMQKNCLHVAGPACDTCKTKRTINHFYGRKFDVGRRVVHQDLQATLFMKDAFACLQALANLTIAVDTFAWASWNIYRRYCSQWNRMGIVDAMVSPRW